MTRHTRCRACLASLALLAACGAPSPDRTPEVVADPAAQMPPPRDPPPDSTWVAVTGPTLIAFHPIATNDELASDEDLATVLDDLAYHVGSAMDDLVAMGVTVRYEAGDSVRMWRPEPRVWVRTADSAAVGFLFVDALGRQAVLYGVRTNIELVEYARTFIRTGALRPD